MNIITFCQRTAKLCLVLSLWCLISWGLSPILGARAQEGVQTTPVAGGSYSLFSKTITLTSIKQEAFNLKQSAYEIPLIQAIPELDPPVDGRPESLGLVFQESNTILARSKFTDQLQWYAFARPRAALDKLPFQVYIDNNNDGTYDLRTYADANFDYSSPIIQPPINPGLLPIAGKVLSRFIIGHAQGMGYPQFFDINANGYVRFNGFAPQTVGSSYRVATHNVFAGQDEDYPRFRDIYFRLLDTNTSNLIGLVDSEGFTGAVDINLTPGEESAMKVSATFFPRRDIPISQEPHTGLVGYSSMFWKNENDTPNDPADEAHDCDILVIGYDRDGNGIIDQIIEHAIKKSSICPNHRLQSTSSGESTLLCLREQRSRSCSLHQVFKRFL